MYLLIEFFSAAVVLIPVFLLLNKARFHNRKKTTLYTLFALYLAAVYHVVGLPTAQFLTFDVNLTLIPFVGMVEDLRNTLLNVVLFLPLGFSLPLLWKKFRNLKATLLFGFGMSMTIELLQLFTYRATDVNDVIANTLGALLGFFLYCVASKVLPLRKISFKGSDFWLVLTVTFAVMFVVQPFIATFLYGIF